ncbi:unnamed protein product [Closterium sp. Naga37s-1]|nr:unnamed protein product [Closterium sp. Naga37s-1]
MKESSNASLPHHARFTLYTWTLSPSTARTPLSLLCPLSLSPLLSPALCPRPWQVHFKCAADVAVLAVDEPNRCESVTPLALPFPTPRSHTPSSTPTPLYSLAFTHFPSLKSLCSVSSTISLTFLGCPPHASPLTNSPCPHTRNLLHAVDACMIGATELVHGKRVCVFPNFYSDHRYAATMTTPSVCTEEKAKELEQQLEAMLTDIHPTHDEL